MNFDKVLTIIITIVIVGYVLFLSLPDIVGYIYEAKDVVENISALKNEYILNTYLDSKPSYYFKYEGATYCISVKSLVAEGYLNGEKIEDIDEIIEAYYSGTSYSFRYNKNCVEK